MKSCETFGRGEGADLVSLLTVVSGLVSDKPPKPSLSAWPSSVFKVGKTITLQCRVSHPVLEFSLEWEERTTFQKFSVDGDFLITDIEGQGTGTYSCSYRIEAHPNTWSHRSKPLKLVGPAGEKISSHILGFQNGAQKYMGRGVRAWKSGPMHLGTLSLGVLRYLKGVTRIS
jgi:hypothetical protein